MSKYSVKLGIPGREVENFTVEAEGFETRDGFVEFFVRTEVEGKNYQRVEVVAVFTHILAIIKETV